MLQVSNLSKYYARYASALWAVGDGTVRHHLDVEQMARAAERFSPQHTG
jgi:hypothetical protein